MAFGVETRLPFLDYRLVELCMGLSLESKIRNGWTKWILRKCMTGTVPDAIVWRKDKVGFEAPDACWMTAEEPSMRRTIMSSELVRSISDDVRLEATLSRMTLRNRWRLYSLAIWAERFNIGTGTTGRVSEVFPVKTFATSAPAMPEQHLA